MFTFFHQDQAHQGSIETGRYRHGGRMSVLLIVNGEDYAMLSVNIPSVDLAANEFLFKTYSENEGLLEAMLAAGVIAVIGPEHTAAGPMPVCRLLP